MADAREPLPTQRCRLHGGRFDGQLRLVATGLTLTLTVQHQFEGELWAEVYIYAAGCGRGRCAGSRLGP
jgi:hypothetical protein